MPSVLTARPGGPPPSPLEPVAEHLKGCSVMTYSESLLFRQPWARLFPAASRPGGSFVPGPFELAIFRALEWLAIDETVARGIPFSNPLVLHPREICERLCWRTTMPRLEAVETGLEALSRVRLRGAGGRTAFGLLDSVVSESTTPKGARSYCPRYRIHFDARFVDSINAGHVVPVNWALWVGLGKAPARRLLEVLDALGFGSQDAPSWTIAVGLLEERLPLEPELGADRRREILDQAHQQLIRKEYLEAALRLPGDRIRYLPGPLHGVMRGRLGDHRDRLVQAGIRSGWALAPRPLRGDQRVGHHIPRLCSSR